MGLKPIKRTPIKTLLDVLALGAVLAFVDASLSRAPTHWSLDEAGSLFWLAIFYALGVLLAGTVLRNRARTAGLVVGLFVLARGGLWFYRGNVDPSVSPKDSMMLGIIVAGALLLGVIASRMSKKVKAGSSVALFASAMVAIASVLGLFQRPSVPTTLPLDQVDQTALSQGDDYQDRPNLLLLTLDTVRPDHISAYGYEGIATPNIDALAHDGVRFTRGVAQASITPTSHASILSGVYPNRHGLRGFTKQNRVADGQPLLSEILGGEGYRTAAFIAATTLHPAYGLNRGFDLYHYPVPFGDYLFSGFGRSLLPTLLHFAGLVKDKGAYRRGQYQTADAIRWLDHNGSDPFFLWVHFFDAHDPYFPSGRFQSRKVHHGARWLDRFRPVYKYDSEILGIDSYVGDLVGHLRRSGLLEKTIIVAVSDHGEGLGDHGYFGHTARLYQEQLRLLLLMRYPPRLPQHAIVKAQIRSVDIVPTVLELMDIKHDHQFEGESLLPLIASHEPDHRIAIAETMAPSRTGNRLVSVSDGQFKLIRSLSGEEWLFDLVADPGETRNLNSGLPAVGERLRSHLRRYMSESLEADDGISEPLDEKALERLRSLGYIN